MNRISFALRAVALWLPALLLIILPAVPWHTLPGTGLNVTLNLLVQGWTAVWALFLAGFLWRARLRGGWLTVLLWSGAGLMSLPWLWTPVLFRSEALFRLAGIWALAGMFWLLLQCPVRGTLRRRIYAIVVIAGLTQGVMAFWQIVFPWSAGRWLNYFFAHANGRPLGGLRQVNLLGSFLATALACALHLALPCKGRREATGATLALSVWPSLILMPLAAGLVMTQSRTALAAGVMAVVALLVLSRTRLRTLQVVVCLLAIGVMAGRGALMLRPPLPSPVPVAQTALAGAGGLPTDVNARLDKNRRASNTERMMLLRGTLALIQQHPLKGNGLGTFETTFPGALLRLGVDNPFTVTVAYPHNELLYAWGEGGVLALTGMLLWLLVLWQPFSRLVSALCRAWRCRGEETVGGLRMAARGVLLLPLFAHVMTEFPLYLSATHSVLLLLLLWLATPARVRRVSGVPRTPARQTCRQWWLALTVITLSVVVIVFMVTGLQSAARLREAESFDLMDPSPLMRLMNPYAQADRLLFDSAVSNLIQYNLDRDERWLYRFQVQAGAWLTRHNGANLQYSMMQIAARQGDRLQAEYWRRRGCMSFAGDPRFSCHY
ncbi:Wzy polymerase domain-containing protein [Lelliottia nimipressuralis]